MVKKPIELNGKSVENFTLEYSMTPHNIQEAMSAKDYKKIDNKFNFGFLDKPVWMKISVQNITPNKNEYFLNFNEAFIERVYYCIVQKGKIVKHKKGAIVIICDSVNIFAMSHFYCVDG